MLFNQFKTIVCEYLFSRGIKWDLNSFHEVGEYSAPYTRYTYTPLDSFPIIVYDSSFSLRWIVKTKEFAIGWGNTLEDAIRNIKTIRDESEPEIQEEMELTPLEHVEPGTEFRIVESGLIWLRLQVNADTATINVPGIPVTCISHCESSGLIQFLPHELEVEVV